MEEMKNEIPINEDEYASKEHYRWVVDKADSKRYDFDLTGDSVVFDVGGFDGAWAAKILKMHNCNIHIFEPVRFFFHKILKKLHAEDKVKIHNYGLSDVDREESIFMNGDATSLHVNNEDALQVKLVSFNKFIEENDIKNIDLLKLNIEGEEYRLLKSIIEAGNHKIIQNILVQFHDYLPYYESLREALHNELKLTHRLKFEYKFIWECWEKI